MFFLSAYSVRNRCACDGLSASTAMWGMSNVEIDSTGYEKNFVESEDAKVIQEQKRRQ